MYVSVCAVAGGSSVDEILFPCQIKASAAISVAAELGGCSHNAPACRKRDLGEEGKDRRGGKSAERKGVALTSVWGFTTRLRE